MAASAQTREGVRHVTSLPRVDDLIKVIVISRVPVFDMNSVRGETSMRNLDDLRKRIQDGQVETSYFMPSEDLGHLALGGDNRSYSSSTEEETRRIRRVREDFLKSGMAKTIDARGVDEGRFPIVDIWAGVTADEKTYCAVGVPFAHPPEWIEVSVDASFLRTLAKTLTQHSQLMVDLLEKEASELQLLEP